MEDTWFYVKDDNDSYHSASDSDIIDSETEAELYSTIHYEENLNFNNTENVNFFTSELSVQDSSSSVLTPNEKPFCIEEKSENVNTHLIQTSSSVSNVLDNQEENSISPNKRPILNNKLKRDLNPTKKRKIDSAQEQSVNLCSDNPNFSDLNELPRRTSLNHLQNGISSYNSCAELPSQKKDNTSVIDSSDSDSVLWAEMDSSMKTDFKTNLLKSGDTICLSFSDSDSELPSSSSFKRRESTLKNLSLPSIKIGENSKGLWFINDEDLYRKRKYSHRYHEHNETSCTRCNTKGHTFRSCPMPKKIKCFICGGAHLGSRCMNRMCSNCYSYGHDRKKCRMRPNNFYCALCSVKGHIKENCPDLWRRYHLTTEDVKIVKAKKVKQNTDVYCWNCGDRGHFGALCRFRFSNSLGTWPCVITYDNPKRLLKKRLVEREAPNQHFRLSKLLKNRSAITSSKSQNANLNQNNELNTSFTRKTERLRKRREKKKKMDMRFNKIKEILGEHDFPRTSKQEIPDNSEVPESVDMTMKELLKKRKKNMRRRMKRQQKKSQVYEQNLQGNYIDFNSEMV